MKSIPVIYLLFSSLFSIGKELTKENLIIDITTKVILENMKNKDSTYDALYLDIKEPFNTYKILDTLHTYFPIVITNLYQNEVQKLKPNSKCFNIIIFSDNNIFISFTTIEYQNDTGILSFMSGFKDSKSYYYDKKTNKITEIRN